MDLLSILRVGLAVMGEFRRDPWGLLGRVRRRGQGTFAAGYASGAAAREGAWRALAFSNLNREADLGRCVLIRVVPMVGFSQSEQSWVKPFLAPHRFWDVSVGTTAGNQLSVGW